MAKEQIEYAKKMEAKGLLTELTGQQWWSCDGGRKPHFRQTHHLPGIKERNRHAAEMIERE